jgi:hypothetical protein
MDADPERILCVIRDSISALAGRPALRNISYWLVLTCADRCRTISISIYLVFIIGTPQISCIYVREVSLSYFTLVLVLIRT